MTAKKAKPSRSPEPIEAPSFVPKRKSREFRMLVQCQNADGLIEKHAIFSTLEKAQSYLQMREMCDGLRGLMMVVEFDPEIVGTITFSVTGTKLK